MDRPAVMGVETEQEGAWHSALSGARAQCMGGAEVWAKGQSFGLVSLIVF